MKQYNLWIWKCQIGFFGTKAKNISLIEIIKINIIFIILIIWSWIIVSSRIDLAYATSCRREDPLCFQSYNKVAQFVFYKSYWLVKSGNGGKSQSVGQYELRFINRPILLACFSRQWLFRYLFVSYIYNNDILSQIINRWQMFRCSKLFFLFTFRTNISWRRLSVDFIELQS